MEKRNPILLWVITIGSLVLFGCSSLKHILFQSTAWDLGVFDQATYLISQNLPPISSFTRFHILGDHGALILYPLSLLYRLYPSVYWLLGVQALALSIAVYPLWRIALMRGLSPRRAWLVVGIYFCYPLVFNLNLFDFHPEVIALPAIGWAVCFGLQPQPTWKTLLGFGVAILVALSCKAVIALTLIAMGFWLLRFESPSRLGKISAAVAMAVSVAWFLVVTQWLIPWVGGEGADVSRHLTRYSYLGGSFGEIAHNAIFKPHLILGKIFSLGTLEYFALIFSPLIWRLSPARLTPLVAAAPALAMNLLSSDGAQRDVIHQYNLPILPFLMVAVIGGLADDYGWKPMKSNLAIGLWALLGFLALSRLHFFAFNYWQALDTWQANRSAIALVHDRASVLTTAEIAPHLSHRSVLRLAITDPPAGDVSQYNHILLNLRHPGWLSSRELQAQLLKQIEESRRFQLRFHDRDVYLFSVRAQSSSVAKYDKMPA